MDKVVELMVENYLKRWFKEFGIEYTTEVIEESTHIKTRDLYIHKLREWKLIK